MARNSLLAFALGLALGGSAFLISAHSSPTPDPPAGAAAPAADNAGPHWRMDGNTRGPGAHRPGMAGDPARAALMDLHAIERLYTVEGRSKDLMALYQSVLGKTRNPALRNYAYARMARLELRPANPDQAIATLKQSLDENLQRLH